MRALGILLSIVALFAAACTPDTNVDSTTTTQITSSTTVAAATTTLPPDGFGGEVAIGVDLPIQTLNPFSDEAFGGTNLAGQAVWATIYDIDPGTWERIPETVSSLPSQTPGAIEVGEDGSMTVRYEVRRDATWSDGTPITGADIEFTAVAMFQLATARVAGVDPVMTKVTNTESVERIAWITFSEPSLAFEDALRVILPSHAIQKATDVRLSDGMDWPAGGPFMVSETQEAGSLMLERNTHYWKTDDEGRSLPHLDSVRFVFADEPGAEISLFTGLEVDIVEVPPWPEAIDTVTDMAVNGEVTVEEAPTPILEHLTFQFSDSRLATNAGSPNDLLDYRRAIAMAIDRPQLLSETDVPWMADTPSVLSPLGDTIWYIYDHDDAGAASLIDSMLGSGALSAPPQAVLSTTANGDYRIRIGDALVGSLGKIGIQLETDYVDSLIFFGDSLASGAFDIGMWAWVSDGGYANQLQLLEIFDPASEGTDANFGHWGEDEPEDVDTAVFSELVAEARVTTDAVRFAEIVIEAEEILSESLPLIPLFRRSSAAAWWQDDVINILHNGSVSGLTWNVEWWQKPGE
ncbi:MAG: ABC transporter substrate-binding protein [Actinomycetota bacterium]